MNITDKYRELCSIVREIGTAYPGRKFTLDGHLIGSIGEVVAAESHGIKLYAASSAGHDGVLPDGRRVQIKTTQGRSIGLRECPEVLLVLVISPERGVEPVYFGDGKAPWDAAGRMQRNGQRALSISKLRKIEQTGSSEPRESVSVPYRASVARGR